MMSMTSGPKLAIYAGTFDPIHNGHIDIIQRGLTIFDVIVVAIGVNPKKHQLFDEEKRMELIEYSLEEHRIGLDRVKVTSFTGLLMNYALNKGAVAILRGVRPGDLEYEYQMSGINKELGNIEHLYLMSSPSLSHINSTFIKAVYQEGGRVPSLVPRCIDDALITARTKFIKVV